MNKDKVLVIGIFITGTGIDTVVDGAVPDTSATYIILERIQIMIKNAIYSSQHIEYSFFY